MKYILLLVTLLFATFPLLSQMTVEIEPWGQSYSQPLYMIPWLNDDLVLIEKGGKVKTVDEEGNQLNTILDLSDKIGDTGGERGLLGVALHPDYPSEPYIYFNHTDNSNNTAVVRYIFQASDTMIDPSTRKLILSVDQPFGNHNGGCIAFGPDEYLYIGMGDGGSGGDPMNNAQNLNSLLGKILRIDINKGDPYAIPADNPFAEAQDTQAEIWSYGWRNPWRFSFDSLTEDMWVGDVGQNAVEEISYEAGDAQGGLNYGWRCYEGDREYDLSGDCSGPFVEPIITRTHQMGDASITGGYRFRGDDAGFENHYIFGDFGSGRIYMAVLNTTGSMSLDTLLRIGQKNSIVSFAEDSEGDIYILTIGGTIYELDLDCDINKPSIEADETMVCAGDSTSLFAGTGNGNYQWYKNGELIEGENSGELFVKEEGNYAVRIKSTCNSGISDSVHISFYDALPTPEISVDVDSMSLTTDTGYAEYRWYYSETSTDKEDFTPYDTTTTAVLNDAISGNYYVVVIDANGCTSSSDISEIILSSVEAVDFYNIRLYPNPFSDRITIETDEILGEAHVRIFNPTGKVVAEEKLMLPGEMKLSGSVVKGVYFVEVKDGEKIYYGKVIKQ